MRVVCICEDDSIGNHIRDGLLPEHDVPLIIMPEFGGKSPGRRRQLTPWKLVSKAVSKIFFTVFNRLPSKTKLNRMLESQTGGDVVDQLAAQPGIEIARIPASEVNSSTTAQLIAQYEPDLLFVCGAPILGKSIFGLAKYGSINFHFGYSPKYRGQHCLIWAYMKGDYQRLAGTFLKINSGIDAGAPIAFVYPEVTGADNIESIEIKVANLARKHIASAVNSVDSDLQGEVGEANLCEPVHINFTDYGPIAHGMYLCRRFANFIFRRNKILRKPNVIHESGSKTPACKNSPTRQLPSAFGRRKSAAT